MKKETVLFGTVLLVSLILGGTSVTAMPDKHCHKLASNIDNSVQNANPEFRGNMGPWLNPCTETYMVYDSYANYYDAPYVGRKVFENGDVVGHKMNTRYVICGDTDTAKVENWALYYIRGMPYGVWFNHPLVDRTNEYKMEQCSSL